MPRLRQGFTIQQILFVEINLRQIVPTHLHFNAARGTGRVAAAIMIQFKPKRLGGLQQGEI